MPESWSVAAGGSAKTLGESPLAWRPAYISLGANLGDAAGQVRAALQALADLPGARLLAASSLYHTAPVEADGPDYVNAVAWLETRLGALSLLRALQGIEQRFGRQRPYRNAPRTLDLDLLLLGSEHVQTAELTLPHPRLHLRGFVLVPLAELAPGLVVPGHGPVRDLLPAVADQALHRLPDGVAS